jgi:hypothetical protein
MSHTKRYFEDSGDFYDQRMEQILFGESRKQGEAMDRANQALQGANHAASGGVLVDGNLKTLAAVGKPKLSDVPASALFALGAAMSNGAEKYGRYNYRATGATASVFYDAMMRHLAAWYDGEDFADDSKVHHLAHIMASCAILLDCESIGVFNDDRDKIGAQVYLKKWMKK